MIDLNTILQNDSVKGILEKVGLDEKESEGVAAQALDTIKDKFQKDPKQMSSLLSKNKNTDADEKLKEEVEGSFLDGIMSKLGLDSDKAGAAKGAMPGIMEMITSKLSDNNNDNEGMLSGLFGTVTDMFDGDDNNSKKSNEGILSKITSFFGK